MSYDSFNGVTNINDPSYLDNIVDNISGFLQWGFLNIGGYYNVKIGATTYGYDQSTLRRVTNSSYTDGRVWESARKNWVWQNIGTSIPISGVYVNGIFSTSSGIYSHKINYREGQIIFNSGLPAGTTVKCEYSYNLYDIQPIKPWFSQIIMGDWVTSFNGFAQAGSGAFDVLAQNRVSLPCIVIEPVANRSFKGLQLGGGQIVSQDILIHIFGTNTQTVNRATDWISFLNDKTLHFYNIKNVSQAGRTPFYYDGTLNPSGLHYKNLVDQYFWKKVWLKNSRIEKVADEPLYWNNVRITLEADFGELG